MTRTYRTLLSSRGGVLRQEPRWHTVRNMHGALLDSRVLPEGSDLKRAFIVAMLEHIDAGWQIAEFSSRVGVFFCTRGSERRQISITPTAPAAPTPIGASHLSESPGRDE